jgi:hypothetical protein
MTLRPPRPNSGKARETVLDYEIAQEQTAALGRLGRALEAALMALSRHDEEVGRDPGAEVATERSATIRVRLLRDASTALWCFVVQREACGLRDQRQVMRDYRVSREVQNRMGAFGGGAGRGPA